MDPKPQDDEPVELDDELIIDDDDETEPDENALLREFGL
jgi:hypothetical protein